MTAFIPQISSRPILKELGINNMYKAVIYRLKEMNESLSQLTQTAKLPLSHTVKKDCLTYIKRQCKLIEIAEDLQQRLMQVRMMHPTQLKKAFQDDSLHQLIQEADLLFEMHFQVKKSYVTFVHKYSKPQIQVQVNKAPLKVA